MCCFEDTADEIPPVCCYEELEACCFGGGGLEGMCFNEVMTVFDCSAFTDEAPASMDDCVEVDVPLEELLG